MGNPVSKTAYYCAGVRMLDAQNSKPIVGDTYAEKFMGEEGKSIFAPLAKERMANSTNVARTHLIDQTARRWLANHRNGLVVLVGAGFDSRAFRMPSGQWLEVDEAPVIERKEAVASSSSCPNKLTRVAIDFSRDDLSAKLAPFATTEPVLAIVEGVFPYLEEEQGVKLVKALGEHFPSHTLVCDLTSKAFHDKTAGSNLFHVFRSWGAIIRWKVDQPIRFFEKLGYALKERTPIIIFAAELGLMPFPGFVARWFAPKIYKEGLLRCVFEKTR